MPCTTILVGKDASYDGSTMIARNDDSPSGVYVPKKFTIIHPNEQPKNYKSVISHVEIELPDNPMRYSAVPNVLKTQGIWAASGINEKMVAMTATETITSNPRVLGADPLVSGGIAEEDMVYIVLPYVHTSREGVQRLGSLLEKYGTYEMSGIAFSDVNEIWFLETIGGHHWIAKRVPDDTYVVMPNQQGIDEFDLEDALTTQKNYMCSPDLKEFIVENHLDLSNGTEFSARSAFGSHDDSDHIYNTPRAWFIERYLNPHSALWDGMEADYKPMSDDIPWCMVPEKKLTIEDVKYVLSNHYQGTPFDPYGKHPAPMRFRPVGINRTDFLSILQIRPYKDVHHQAIQWIAFASNPFNAIAPFYSDVEMIPEYLSQTSETVNTNYFYWASRLLAAMADACYRPSSIHIERYQRNVLSQGHFIINKYDKLIEAAAPSKQLELKQQANQEISDMLQKETDDTLEKVLNELSNFMTNAFSRSDA